MMVVDDFNVAITLRVMSLQGTSIAVSGGCEVFDTGNPWLSEARNGRCSTTFGFHGLITAERDGYKWRNIL